MRRFIWLAISLVGCTNNFPDYSYVHSFSLLAVTAEPPDLPPSGGAVALHAETFDPAGNAVTANWALCTLVPDARDPTLNPTCVTEPLDGADFVALGSGTDPSVTVPAVKTMGQLPDATGGLYAPLRADLAAGDARITAVYRLRVHLFGPANHNPAIASLERDVDVDAGGSSPLADNDVFHPGDPHTLRSLFTDGSAEDYVTFDIGTQKLKTVTETLSTAWFSTAGAFSDQTTDTDDNTETPPFTTFTLDAKQPAGPIQIWAIGRDERGGTTVAHRTIMVQ